jgi:hydrogenase-4 component B
MAFALWVVAALLGLVGRRGTRIGLPLLVEAGCLVTLVAAAVGGDCRFALPMPLYLGLAPAAFLADGLSRWFLLLIGLVGAAVVPFAPAYLRHLERRVSLGVLWAALAGLMASMCLVVMAANAVVFLVAWEAMALTSFALVASDHERRSVRQAALVYLCATRVGTGFLMAGFLWLHQITGSWVFSQWSVSGAQALGPCLLILVGLATKAGCWPFHLWLPVAHPAAPAPVSALMSGVMIKTAIYAMARLFLLGPLSVPLMGPLLLVLGAISALWGVLFALLQHDLKRLLAYHSVENIGLILMGLGLAGVGTSLGSPLLRDGGLAAALFHTLNHGVFKSLLFLGAGAVETGAHTRDIEQLGGLAKRMPWTAACFIAGSAAICALPPLNGFASEWVLYQGFFALARTGPSVVTRLSGLLLMAWLGVIGALALGCFVKAVGVVFLGRPRSHEAAHAHEAAASMRAPQVLLALCCVVLGLLAPVVVSHLASVVRPAGQVGSAGLLWNLPLLPLAVALVLGVLAVAGLVTAGSRRPRERYITWECGFGELGAQTQYTAASFAQPILRLFGRVYSYSLEVAIEGADHRHFPESVVVTTGHEPYLETRVYRPLLRLVQRGAGGLLMRLQAGSIHQYLLYMIVALGLLLWLGARP